MTTLAQDDLPGDAEVLRTLTRYSGFSEFCWFSFLALTGTPGRSSWDDALVSCMNIQ